MENKTPNTREAVDRYGWRAQLALGILVLLFVGPGQHRAALSYGAELAYEAATSALVACVALAALERWRAGRALSRGASRPAPVLPGMVSVFFWIGIAFWLLLFLAVP